MKLDLFARLLHNIGQGMIENDTQLLAFLEKELVPDIKESNKPHAFCDHWLVSLANNSLAGSHRWNNLGQVILTCQYVLGRNYQTAVNYCKAKAGVKA